MKYVFFLGSPKDVALAFLLRKTAQVDLKVVVSNVTIKDKYGWKKSKFIEPCFPPEEMASLRNTFGDDLYVYSRESDLDCVWDDNEVSISRGREFSVLKSKAKKNIALSLTGSYLGRLYDVIPYYNGNVKIIFFSKAWSEHHNLLNMGVGDHHDVEKYRNNFDYGDIYGYYHDYLKKNNKDELKNQLGIPLNRKIALLSFRMAAAHESIHKNQNDFMTSLVQTIKKFKDDGYFIISRRRLGLHDLKYYSSMKTPEVSRFNEVSYLIDKEMNGVGEFPYDLWKSMHVSDVLLLMDNSGICYIEAAISRCPIYMPYSKDGLDRSYKELLPASRDMFDKNLIFNDYTEENIKHYHQNIETFLSKWYDYDVDGFWGKILND